MLFGERLLPQRTPRSIAPDFSDHARTLVAQYELDEAPDALLTRSSGVAEVVIPPRSELAGDTVFPGMVTPSGDLVILAVQRQGEDVGPGETVLAEGDTLLLQRHLGGARRQPRGLGGAASSTTPELVRRQAVPLGMGAKRAIAVLAAMVVLLATGAVPPVVAGLLAASRARRARRADRRAGPARHLVDDRRAGGRHDLALDGDDRDRRGRDAGRRARAHRRRRRAVRAARRAVRAHRDARAADQQHGDGADRHPDRRLGRRGHGRVGQAGPDGRDRLGGGVVPHARWPPRRT